MNAKKLTTMFWGLAFAATATGSFAADAKLDGKALYTQKACHTCHGPDGNKTTIDTYPKLGGQNKNYLVSQVKDIRDGKRTNGLTMVMKPLVAPLTDAEIEAIAEYLANVK